MPVLPNDAKRAFVQPLVFDGTMKSAAVNLKGFALSGLLITTAVASTSVTFELGYADAFGTFVPLRDKAGAALTVTVTGTGFYSFAGAIPMGVHAIKYVGNSVETATTEATAKAFLIGQPVL